jgi:hypothetical protein
VDLKTAAFSVAQTIRKFHQLESLEKCIEKAERQLKGLDSFSAINNQAIVTLINLQLAGYSEKDIKELANFSRWSKSNLGLGSPGQGNCNLWFFLTEYLTSGLSVREISCT